VFARDALRIAIATERSGLAFYTRAATMTKDARGRSVFHKLASEEREHLATLELWPEPPEWEAALRFRNWAFESAALDLALRQAGHSLHDVLGLTPTRCATACSLGKEPSIEPVRRRLPARPARFARRGGDWPGRPG
jgi:hypothetical protein